MFRIIIGPSYCSHLFNSLFKDFSIDGIESNTEWNCKLQTNFHSKGDGLLKDNIINDLSEDILSYIQKEIKKHNFKSIDGLFYTDSKPWYNIYKKGFSQERHNHKGGRNVLSGVYYYKSPSTIRFFKWPFEKSEVVADFEPVEGNIILFPSIIDHSVLEYNDDNIRISIAFNFGIKDDTIK